MFDEDLDAFLDVDDFAVEGIYDGDQVVVGILNNGHAVSALGIAGVMGTDPTFLCKAADVDADPAGKTLAIDVTTWTIQHAEPDGTGMVRLVLRRA